jgi:hypothetical protein
MSWACRNDWLKVVILALAGAALGPLAREAFFFDGQGTPSPPRSPFPSSAQFAEIRAPKAPHLCLLF